MAVVVLALVYVNQAVCVFIWACEATLCLLECVCECVWLIADIRESYWSRAQGDPPSVSVAHKHKDTLTKTHLLKHLLSILVLHFTPPLLEGTGVGWYNATIHVCVCEHA